jgi:hypothetical protein
MGVNFSELARGDSMRADRETKLPDGIVPS